MSDQTVLNDRQIRQTILVIILPIILESVFQVSANIVSTAMVGRLSPMDISAQGICFSISGLVLVLVKGISIGAALYISRAYGEKNFDKARELFTSGLIATIAFMFLVIVLILMFAGYFFTFMTNDPQVIEIANHYIKILVLGMPFVAISSFVTAAHQGFGNTKTPMGIAIVMNIINILLGYVLIFGMSSFKGLGIYGAGIALVCAQVISGLLGLYLVFHKRGLFEKCKPLIVNRPFKWGKLVSKEHIKAIYLMGIPVSIESIFGSYQLLS